ncbi:hypothetical protein [Arsenicicoccus piscis]|uniref:CobW C-terminal domain-containing protein n=1 Tax=Arsenicicoccus piscis TaxID=673954 RepID=A0ABQ6HKK2_9MICO|nr:hypothetical protein [Arsenicicoccus piscis]GMA18682.1 hypothetical protein GCM10025862_07030 [Arsenicicoccus piscis]
MQSRQARPTLRVLREDLGSGWTDPFPQRLLSSGGDLQNLMPLSALPHPLVRKAAECFADGGGLDTSEGPIRSAPAAFPLSEIKVNQWRGGVWRDAQGTHWLVVAGLAKCDHKDADDFYQRVGLIDADRIDQLRPTEEDREVL